LDFIIFGENPMRAGPRTKRRSGAATVELALVLPLFFMVVFSLIDVSRLGMVAQLLAGAAREGGRVAVVPGSTQPDVQARVNAFLSGSGVPTVTSSNLTITPSTWTTASSGTAITVSISVPFSHVSWFGTPYIFGSTTLNASATFSSENP
jgi:Flp pilus assembly protein TadG